MATAGGAGAICDGAGAQGECDEAEAGSGQPAALDRGPGIRERGRAVPSASTAAPQCFDLANAMPAGEHASIS